MLRTTTEADIARTERVEEPNRRWMPWWLPAWVPIVTVGGVLAIGAVVYLLITVGIPT